MFTTVSTNLNKPRWQFLFQFAEIKIKLLGGETLGREWALAWNIVGFEEIGASLGSPSLNQREIT